MRVLVLQHVPFEAPGAIRDWFDHRGYSVQNCLLSAGEPLPAQDSFDLLLIMGGPMGVYDVEQYPWLRPEIEFIKAAIAEEKRVLGICLGAQLIAAALGAAVYPGPVREIGWFPIRLTSEGRCDDMFGVLDGEFIPLHWHGDTFDLPARATLLASSAVYPNQAFRYGERVIGLQFHLELRPEEARTLIAHCGTELKEGEPHVQTIEEIAQNPARFARANTVLQTFLERWLPQRGGAR